MATSKRVARPEAGSSQRDPAVVAFLHQLNHPLKQDIEAVREIILGASREIREGIKWKAPSFRTTEYFATVNVRAKEGVQLVFHRGAKVRHDLTQQLKIADPEGLIKWLAKDRCLVTLGTGKDIQARKASLRNIVREWIQHV